MLSIPCSPAQINFSPFFLTRDQNFSRISLIESPRFRQFPTLLQFTQTKTHPKWPMPHDRKKFIRLNIFTSFLFDVNKLKLKFRRLLTIFFIIATYFSIDMSKTDDPKLKTTGKTICHTTWVIFFKVIEAQIRAILLKFECFFFRNRRSIFPILCINTNGKLSTARVFESVSL